MLLETTVYDIPRRLKEIDPLLELEWNERKRVFRVLRRVRRDVYIGRLDGARYYERREVLLPVMTVPRDQCDARVLAAVRRGMRDSREILREIDEHNERLTRTRERDLENHLEGALDYYYAGIRRELDH